MADYRMVGFLRDGDETVIPINAENDADAWSSLVPQGVLVLSLEKNAGEGWTKMQLSSSSLMQEIGNIVHGLLPTPTDKEE